MKEMKKLNKESKDLTRIVEENLKYRWLKKKLRYCSSRKIRVTKKMLLSRSVVEPAVTRPVFLRATYTVCIRAIANDAAGKLPWSTLLKALPVVTKRW